MAPAPRVTTKKSKDSSAWEFRHALGPAEINEKARAR
jgi:hypothetical protein